MCKLSVIFLLILLGARLCAATAAPDLRVAISREAAKCALAVQREDISTLVSCLHPTVLQHSGGRAAVMAEVKAQFAAARKYGAERIEVTPRLPSVPKKMGRWLTSMLPVTAVAQGLHVEVTQETQVLVVSSDQGKRWYIVPLYETTQAELDAWFPELRGKIVVPAQPKPNVRLVY